MNEGLKISSDCFNVRGDAFDVCFNRAEHGEKLDAIKCGSISERVEER